MLGIKNSLFKALAISQKAFFAVSSNDVQSRVSRITAKASLKQTVVDKKKLQGYLEQTKVDKNLNQALTRTARYDQEFNDFLKQYKEKNKEHANILDLSHYAEDQSLIKSQKMREEELIMLEEFRKRKQDKTLYLDSDDEGAEKVPKKKPRKTGFEEEEDAAKKVIDPKRFTRDALAQDVKKMNEEKIKETFRTLYAKESFMILLLERGVTTLVTTLNRVNHFRYLVYMGNCNGVIGYGTGQGANFEIALRNAIRNCKKNLVALNLDHLQTLTLPIEVKTNGMRFYLFPRSHMNAYGSPTMAHMLVLSGVTHCSFYIVARNPNPYNLVYCLFKALTRCVTPKQMAETMGFKLFHQSYMPWKYYDQNHGPLI